MSIAPTLNFFHYIMNPGMLGTQTYSKFMPYSEPWNIQKSDGIYGSGIFYNIKLLQFLG